MTPTFDPGPNPYGKPPVLVGALGPRMTEIAAEVADGILVMPFNSARHLQERTLPAIARGLAKGGRNAGDVEIVCEAIVAMGETDEEIAAAIERCEGAALVLRVHSLVSAGPRRRRTGASSRPT